MIPIILVHPFCMANVSPGTCAAARPALSPYSIQSGSNKLFIPSKTRQYQSFLKGSTYTCYCPSCGHVFGVDGGLPVGAQPWEAQMWRCDAAQQHPVKSSASAAVRAPSPLPRQAAGGCARTSTRTRLRGPAGGEALQSEGNSRRLPHLELDAGIRGRPTRMQIFRSWAGGHPSAMILGFGHILQRSADIVWGLRSRDMSFCPECVFDQINTWHLINRHLCPR